MPEAIWEKRHFSPIFAKHLASSPSSGPSPAILSRASTGFATDRNGVPGRIPGEGYPQKGKQAGVKVSFPASPAIPSLLGLVLSCHDVPCANTLHAGGGHAPLPPPRKRRCRSHIKLCFGLRLPALLYRTPTVRPYFTIRLMGMPTSPGHRPTCNS